MKKDQRSLGDKLKSWIMQDRGGYDYTLLFAIIFIACFGLVMVYSSSSYVAYTQFGSSFYFFKRQAFFMLLGIAAMFVVSKIDYHLWLKFAVLGILSAIVLMLLVNFTPFGIEFNGKKRWFGIAGHSLFQAAEYVKIVLIIGLAAYVNRVGKRVDKWPTIVITALISIPLCLLVSLPLIVLAFAQLESMHSAMLGDPSGMPSHMPFLMSAVLFITTLLLLSIRLFIVYAGYYAWGSAEARQREREKQKLNIQL